MAWVYLDDQFPDHPKVVAAGGDAAWLFVCMLAYCRRHRTGGVIQRAQVARLTDRRQPLKLAARLIGVGLLEDKGGDFAVHDYTEWNRSEESRSAAGRRAAAARWSKRDASETQCESYANGNANASDSHMRGDALSLSPPYVGTSTSSVASSTGGSERLLHEAVAILAERAIQRTPSRTNRTAHIAGIRAGKLSDHQAQAARLIVNDRTLTAERLADLLEPKPVAAVADFSFGTGPTPVVELPDPVPVDKRPPIPPKPDDFPNLTRHQPDDAA